MGVEHISEERWRSMSTKEYAALIIGAKNDVEVKFIGMMALAIGGPEKLEKIQEEMHRIENELLEFVGKKEVEGGFLRKILRRFR